MVKRKPYLWEKGKGSGKWHVRYRGKYYPLKDQENRWLIDGTPEFDNAYWEVRNGKRAQPKRTWSALIKLLRETDEWKDQSPRYRRDLEKVFDYLEEKIGNRDVARLMQADIYDAMDKNRHRVRFANYIPTAISKLSKLAMRKRWRQDNPAKDITPLKMPKSKKQPHVPWPDWAVDKWRAEAQPLPLLIFEIGVGSVQRPADWVDFTWGDYDGESLQLSQNKTGKLLSNLPCTPQLKEALDRAKAALGFTPHPDRHILTRADGSKMDYHAMARPMRRERARLDLMAYDQHALRYRGVMELAWAGCDDDEIMSFSGHDTKKMVIKYAGLARQIMRASSAAEKRNLWSKL